MSRIEEMMSSRRKDFEAKMAALIYKLYDRDFRIPPPARGMRRHVGKNADIAAAREAQRAVLRRKLESSGYDFDVNKLLQTTSLFGGSCCFTERQQMMLDLHSHEHIALAVGSMCESSGSRTPAPMPI